MTALHHPFRSWNCHEHGSPEPDPLPRISRRFTAPFCTHGVDGSIETGRVEENTLAALQAEAKRLRSNATRAGLLVIFGPVQQIDTHELGSLLDEPRTASSIVIVAEEMSRG